MASKKIKTPKISVIIPLFNGEKYLEEVINSVLRQSFQDFELIIVDNGSTDGSISIVNQFKNRIKLLKEPRKGVAAARNSGIKNAQGACIAFLDQDDYYLPSALESLYKAIKNTDLMAVMGKTQYLFETPLTRKRWPQISEEGILFSKLLGACVFKRELFEKLGYLLENPEISDDVEWFYRLDQKGIEIQKIDSVTLTYRQHDNNTTSSQSYTQGVILKLLKHTLDQRRKTNAS
jgi:glycosyltransferase involved in cell wall biosynthesis